MKIIAKDNSPLLGPGEHEVTIKQVFTDTAKPSDLYTDVTEQLAVLFEDASGKVITRWYNLKGYEVNAKAPTRKDSEGRDVPNYAIDKSGARLENVANTKKALAIISGLAIHAGFDEDHELDASDLVGKSCNIMVQRDAKFNSSKVAYTMKPSKVAKDAEAEIA
jgi:hypothetical protein